MVHHKVVRSIFIADGATPPRLNRRAVSATRRGSASPLALARTSLKHAIASAKLESVPMDAKFIVGAVREATEPIKAERAKKASGNG